MMDLPELIFRSLRALAAEISAVRIQKIRRIPADCALPAR